MRRQTILLAAALAVAMPATAAITKNRSDSRDTQFASRDPAAPTARDRLILKIRDAKAGAYSIAPADEASLLSGLARAHKLPEVAPAEAPALVVPPKARPAPAATTPDLGGFSAHHGFGRAHEFVEDRGDRVSLNIAPVTLPTYRDGDPHAMLRADGEAYGTDVAGLSVGLSFRLN